MIRIFFFFSFFFFQGVYSIAQTKDSIKIYLGTIELKNENPIPENPRFRKIIFTCMGSQSTLELIDYFKNFKGELIEISKERINVDKIENNFYIFKPLNSNVQLLIRVKKRCSNLIIKRIKGSVVKRKNIIKLKNQ